MKKTVAVFFIFLTILACNVAEPSFCGATAEQQNSDKPYKFVHYEYLVKDGDTLSEISQRFIERNNYGKRGLAEFISGIIEINPCLWETKKVKAGQKIWINWFESVDEI